MLHVFYHLPHNRPQKQEYLIDIVFQMVRFNTILFYVRHCCHVQHGNEIVLVIVVNRTHNTILFITITTTSLILSVM